ncbi:GAF and ANTAR domain-containing protein [Streptomonospora salina]|uniref:Transcriptional regulator with GAF, ATPase, and Fis domain n=1 Tax=Streptomonospora salina TaxID=104205 RepID=A0A841E902_9ACTN|nr:GAF and ANTAR domain-containing protein [Streptomonospora salina]MBB5997588.1 transcriptional regulator with GAF, ATPase, and Fis domain [Streptomonospora salina]
MNNDPENLSHTIERMARDLLDQGSVQTTVGGITELAVSEIEGTAHASISLVHKSGSITTQAATDPVTHEIDRIQYHVGQGPCLAAIWEHDIFTIDDMDTETRWPEFVEGARGLGVCSMLAFRLYTHRDTLGALNLYGTEPAAFTESSRETGQRLAAHAAVALAGAQKQEHLTTALGSRQYIGEATGILMERYKVSSDQAFAMLAHISQNLNVKLRDLAEDLVRTGALPEQQTDRPKTRRAKPGT